MSILKENYQSLAFPLKQTRPEDILEHYLNEFNFSLTKMDERKVLILYTNALRDYLNDKISSWMLEAVSLQLVFYNKGQLKKKVDKRYPLLSQVLFETTDLTWLEESKNFSEYKTELNKKLHNLTQITL